MDALGNPLGFMLTPGQASDLDGADRLPPTLAAEAMLADKDYDADQRVIEPLRAAGKQAVILPSATGNSRAPTIRNPTRQGT